MPQESSRTTKRKKIKLPGGETMYVPVITQISFIDPFKQYQEYQYQIDSSEGADRTVHTDTITPIDVDKDGVPTEDEPQADDTSEKLYVERIDKWSVIDPFDSSQESEMQLDNTTGNDKLPPHFSNHTKTHIYRYHEDPQNPDDDGVWIDSELLDEFSVIDPFEQSQERQFTLVNNPTNAEFRDGDLSGQASDQDDDLSIDSEGEGTEQTPVRLDPFQNIVNFSGGYWLVIQVGSAFATGSSSDFSTAKELNGSKPNQKGHMTWPNTRIKCPEQDVPLLGPHIHINYPGHPDSCFDTEGEGGFLLEGNSLGCGVSDATPCFAEVPQHVNQFFVGSLFTVFINPSAPKNTYVTGLSEDEFVAAVTLPLPDSGWPDVPSKVGDKLTHHTAGVFAAQLDEAYVIGGSTLFYTIGCVPPYLVAHYAGGPVGFAPIDVSWNHDDIYLFGNVPINSASVADEDQKAAVSVTFNMVPVEGNGAGKATVSAILYKMKDWEPNPDFKWEVDQDILKFNTTPIIRQKDADGGKVAEAGGDAVFEGTGTKTVEITIIKKGKDADGNDVWEIEIEE